MDQTIGKVRYVVFDNEGRHVVTLNQLTMYHLLRDAKWTRDSDGYIFVKEVTGVEMAVAQGIIAEVFVYPGYHILEEVD